MSDDPVAKFKEMLKAEADRYQRGRARAEILIDAAPPGTSATAIGAIAWLSGDKEAANVILSAEMFRFGSAIAARLSATPADSQESAKPPRTVGCPYCSASHDPLASGVTLTCLKCGVCTNTFGHVIACPQCDSPTSDVGSTFYRRGQHV